MISLAVLAAGWVIVLSPGDYAILKFPPLSRHNHVIAAVILVMIVVVAALGVRTGLLVGIAIPGSFLTGILVLATFGLTVNIVVLFSLILAVGLLVDGAIVVTEYADRRMTEGLRPSDAYALASKHRSWPIIASTATTLAALSGRALARAPVGGGFPAPPFRLRGGFTVPP